MQIATALSQGATLVIESEGEPHVDDPAWVDMPFGPLIDVDIKLVEKELAEHGLALIPVEEDEPEIIGNSTLRVWCYSTLNP